MNKVIGLVLLGLATFAFSSICLAAPDEINRDQLKALVHSSATPVVIEFYSSSDPDASGECARQKPIFDDVSNEYSGRVTFVRFDITQDPAMAEAGRLVVCPTHLFVNHGFPDPTTDPTSVPNRTPYRQWGLLTKAQLEELIGEFFGVAKP